VNQITEEQKISQIEVKLEYLTIKD